MIPLHDKSWTIRCFPELRLVADPVRRQRVWSKAVNLHSKTAILITGLWPLMVILAYGHYVIPWTVSAFDIHPASAPLTFAAIASAVLVPAILPWIPLMLWVGRRGIRRSLRVQMSQLGYPICIHCGYDLQGQTAPRCPECGMSFDPRLLKPQESDSPPPPLGSETEGERG